MASTPSSSCAAPAFSSVPCAARRAANHRFQNALRSITGSSASRPLKRNGFTLIDTMAAATSTA
ncbi:hypothetical protein D3C86_2216650 [compost metagenome]